MLDTRGKFTLSIAYSPDGKYIASGAIDGIINIFEMPSGKVVKVRRETSTKQGTS